jgi:hypothetical protein
MTRRGAVLDVIIAALWLGAMITLAVMLGGAIRGTASKPEPPHHAVTLLLQTCDDDRPGAPVRGTCIAFDDASVDQVGDQTVTLMKWPYGDVIAPLVPCGTGSAGACYASTDHELWLVTLP